jgi:hypothetical protein
VAAEAAEAEVAGMVLVKDAWEVDTANQRQPVRRHQWAERDVH